MEMEEDLNRADPSIEDLILGNVPIKGGAKSFKMIPLRGVVAFPNVLFSFDLGRDKSLLALNRSLDDDSEIVLLTQKNSVVTNPEPDDMCRTGVLARVKQVLKMGENVRVLAQTLERVEVVDFITNEPYFQVAAREKKSVLSDEIKAEAFKRRLKEVFSDFIKIDNRMTGEAMGAVMREEDCERVGWMIANSVLVKEDARRKFLETTQVEKMLETLLTAVVRETEITRIERQITGRVRRQMDKNQREYYLREQLKAIHEELGDNEDEIAEYRKRAVSCGCPPEVAEKINKEITRISKMNPTSPETAVARTYVETLLDLPWNKESGDNEDLAFAARILDEDHYGLAKIKDRILEYLAVTRLTKSLKGPILCFVGPPGVGKTSVARSIARCLNRKFATVSLGGMRDEAEIRGHRRTYIGAIPGRIINSVKTAGVRNPVILLDEIEKMGSDFRGDPTGAMLEVLDPEQNGRFCDHYLEIPFDLSRVMFIATANVSDTIPPPLLDRMELIELSGYTLEEKARIARNYLLKKQEDAHGVSGRIEISDEVIELIIMKYTREAGVRALERAIADICRKCARRAAEDKNAPEKFVIAENDLPAFLGVSKFRDVEMSDPDEVGAATGLAWTAVGGVTMTIEVALTRGKGELKLTGKLGDVMKESAAAALTVVKRHAAAYNVPLEKFNEYDVHLHVPEGATPKDGPSAGVTIAVALLSAFSGRKVRRGIAMTGEITLRGKVLAIGGLKDKAFACRRAGMKTLLIPSENEKDLPDIPVSVREAVTIKPVSEISEVFDAVLYGAKKNAN